MWYAGAKRGVRRGVLRTRDGVDTIGAAMARVLVVDDDTGIRETLGEALRAAGHEVGEAADGETAMRVLRDSPCRLIVLLDIMMPRVSGFDVLAEIVRDDTLARRHACIVVTAYPRALPPLATANRLSALDIPMPILAKPFDLDTLLAIVSDAAVRLLQTSPLPVTD